MLKQVISSLVPENALIHLQAMNHYLFGEPEIRLLKALCSSSRIAIDIGANIGTYTYFMRRYALAVQAYEPNPELAKRLTRLFPEVPIRSAAVSDQPGTLKLRLPVKNGRPQHELGSVAQQFGEEAVEYDVSAIRLDDEHLRNVGFIKIDVEQHETSVLQGALGTIRQSRPNLMTEVTPLLYPSPLPVHFSFLTDLDYVGWFRFQGHYLSLSQFDPKIHANPAEFGKRFMGTNVIFLPAESRVTL
jgi:FkbM family methyltransferase